MNFTKNWSIRLKLFVTLGIIVVIAVVQSLVLMWHLKLFVTQADAVILEQEFGQILTAIEPLNIRFIGITKAYLDGGNQVTRDNYNQVLEYYKERIASAKSHGFDEEQIERLQKIDAIRTQLFDLESQALLLKANDNTQSAKAIVESESYREVVTVFENVLKEDIQNTENNITVYVERRNKELSSIWVFLYSSLATIVLIGSLLVWSVSRAISRAAKEAEAAAVEIARGETVGRVTVSGGDEISRIAIAFNKCVVALDKTSRNRLKQITKDIGE